MGDKRWYVQCMAKHSTGKFSRRGPDIVSEELAKALLGKHVLEFKPLFALVYAGLQAREGASGGEEMMRLRVYEKLQSFVSKGLVTKTITAGIKEYRGLPSLSSVLPLTSAVATTTG